MLSGKESIDKSTFNKATLFCIAYLCSPWFFDIAVAIGIRQLPWVTNLHWTPFLLHPYLPLRAPARAGGTQGLQKVKAERPCWSCQLPAKQGQRMGEYKTSPSPSTRLSSPARAVPAVSAVGREGKVLSGQPQESVWQPGSHFRYNHDCRCAKT